MNLLDHWTDLENHSYLSDGCELEYFEGGGDQFKKVKKKKNKKKDNNKDGNDEDQDDDDGKFV